MKIAGFDNLIKRLRDCAADLLDRRTGKNIRYSMADIALSAFAIFFTQSPSAGRRCFTASNCTDCSNSVTRGIG
jgi:hypothetical protein